MPITCTEEYIFVEKIILKFSLFKSLTELEKNKGWTVNHVKLQVFIYEMICGKTA